MSVRTAVATTNGNTPAQLSPQQAIKSKLEQYRPVIAKLLAGTGVTEETFVAQIANACRATPQLWNCEPESVLGAALKAAQLGLAPNDARNQCFILPYKNQAQFQLGYGGVMELARRATPGLRFDGRPVYPNDEFDLDFGKAEPLTHRPAIVKGQQRGGEAYAWYVRATFPDGSVQVHVLDREGVEYHRGFSKHKDGLMWTRSFDAAALKSVVHDMRRWLPSSTQLTAAFASDEQVVDVRTIEADPDVIDIDEPSDTLEPPTPAAPAPSGEEAGQVGETAGPSPSTPGEPHDGSPDALAPDFDGPALTAALDARNIKQLDAIDAAKRIAMDKGLTPADTPTTIAQIVRSTPELKTELAAWINAGGE